MTRIEEVRENLERSQNHALARLEQRVSNMLGMFELPESRERVITRCSMYYRYYVHQFYKTIS
jgi:hypothetical protein